ncbi:MAG: hypothetical protein EB161_09055 [Nitrosopumilaceae archaeon]|nr:hypothetical protein [Nitrosopumilaceae archaeon]NDF48219.1 hypothetical protein [Nitrosopumilaceae archaeon]
MLLLFPLFGQASGHALFNSAEETIGDRRVQIATDPEIPEINDKVKVLFRVTDLELKEVSKFTIGVRIFYNDEQIDGIPPQTIESGHWNFDYVFKKHGNHIFRVDLYDDNGKVRTYTFNVSTQSPFGYIFIYVIASGAFGAALIFGYIYLPKRIKKLKR